MNLLSNDLNGSLGFDFESSNSEDLDVRVTYALFDHNYNLLDEKDSVVNRVYIPEKFSLKQNGDLNLPIGFNFKAGTAEDLDVRVTYAFFDDNYNLLDEKDSVVNRVFIPEEFSLKQNYPNPFNPYFKNSDPIFSTSRFTCRVSYL